MQFRLLLGALLPLIVCACGEQPQSAPQTSSGGSGGVGGTGDMGVGGENQAGATSSSGGSGGTQTDGGAGGEPGCSSKMPTIERGKVEPTDVTQATFGFVNNATNDLSFAWTWGQTVVSLSTQLSDGTFVTRSPFSSADPDQRPRAQIAANGRAFLAASDGGTVHLASAETATSEDWTLHTLPAANHTRVFFASNDENRVIAAWTQKDEEGPYVIVWSEYLPDSDSWAEPRPVVELNVHFPVVDLVADDDGDFHLLYYKNGTHIARLGASADAFSESESLSINSPTGTFSLASDGTLVAAFHSDTQASKVGPNRCWLLRGCSMPVRPALCRTGEPGSRTKPAG